MPRPNILHMFVDQQRFDTIGALNNPVIKTPNLDRLVKSGVAFTNAYSPSPVCISARCSMIFGQYPANTGCYENTMMPDDGRSTFMNMLSENGYRTHGIGKCHFSPDALALRGFQTREIQEEGGTNSVTDYPYMKYLQDKGYAHLLEPNGVRGEMYYMPQPSQLPPQDHPTQWIGDRSVSFISGQKDVDQPWYLFSSFIHPHPPFAPPSPWHKLYRGDDMPLPNIPDQYEFLQTYVNKCQNRYKYRDGGYDRNHIRMMKAYYYACISFVDFQIGRILDELEQTGQLNNTMIIFTGDHGEHLGDYRCFGKRSMHDSCARIPLLISMPGRFSGGTVCDTAASLVDIAPTILAAAGTALPGHALDGVDLYKLVSGESDREYVFSQLSFQMTGFLEQQSQFSQLIDDPDRRRAVFSTYMAASKNWKYFYSAPDNREYLFDKQKDPRETRNAAAAPMKKEAKTRIKNALIKHLELNGETLGIEDHDFIPFSVPPFVKDPDAGHLIQDGYTPWAEPNIPGYSED